MKRSNRLRWFGAIALGIIILLSLFAAPSANNLNGSTYSRAPSGYGAWYAFMQQQGQLIERWQKPFSDLAEEQRPVTLLRVNYQLQPQSLESDQRNWVEKGNNLVILGVGGQVTAAEFSTVQRSPNFGVKIDTTRRQQLKKGDDKQLGDRFGAVVWQEKIGKGQVIYSTTPHLAANAYQDDLGNYKYLAQLVNNSGKILVDEYIHGYKDKSATAEESENAIAYLAKTPIFPALLQTGVLLLVLIWAQNRRFGSPLPLTAPTVDNSEAYIQALAGVLQKAESSEFVLDVVGKEEQLQLQQSLGLGQTPLEHQTLVNAWVQKMSASTADLEQVLRLQSQKRRVSETQLLNWLKKWQTIHQKINDK